MYATNPQFRDIVHIFETNNNLKNECVRKRGIEIK